MQKNIFVVVTFSFLMAACNGKVIDDKITETKRQQPKASGCTIDSRVYQYCANETGSWGYEQGKICVSSRFCPSNRLIQVQTPMSDSPIDSQANKTTQTIYAYLKSIWGKKTLSGQQDLTWNDSTDMYQRVINDTGKAPAIMGYDFMNYTQYTSGSGLSQVEEAKSHWKRGGLVTFCWHWRDPSKNTREFYTSKTDFEIPIVHGELDVTSKTYNQMEQDIDLIAAQLKILQENNVTVIWRPLHEASGGWFWWGRPRTDDVPTAFAYVVLYRHIFDRLVNHHQLHNLIWVWNAQNPFWYPGDAYVDVVSTDLYESPQNYSSQLSNYNLIKNSPLQNKLTALTENSNIPDPDNMLTDGAMWLWFVTWNDSASAEGITNKDNFWTGEYYNTKEHKTKVYNHANVITLDELPKFTQ